jgi:hypothetical protein
MFSFFKGIDLFGNGIQRYNIKQMSLATLKKKTQAAYNNNSVGQKHFSLNGGQRSQGWVGQDSRGRTLVRSLAKGNTLRGHGGCCGKYPKPCVVPSEVKTTENSNVVKTSVLNYNGMMHTVNPWIWRPAPITSFKIDSNHGVFESQKQNLSCPESNSHSWMKKTMVSHVNIKDCYNIPLIPEKICKLSNNTPYTYGMSTTY